MFLNAAKKGAAKRAGPARCHPGMAAGGADSFLYNMRAGGLRGAGLSGP